MTPEYRPRHWVPLEPGATYRQPPQPADWVQLGDPALGVFTDFLDTEPRTVAPEVSIDTALERMKAEGVRLLLVVDAAAEIVGAVTARDIQGERPVQLAQERRVAHSDLLVRDIMTPRAELPVLNMISVEEATVGHILATLQALERQHSARRRDRRGERPPCRARDVLHEPDPQADAPPRGRLDPAGAQPGGDREERGLKPVRGARPAA
ncbi:MAG: CBS domain-containing protein [Halofilum sp. (in: g-proteobacteria)]|nr:CBS domain-containing protein [Halofilum sp. (in: g-proteobacteria)]